MAANHAKHHNWLKMFEKMMVVPFYANWLISTFAFHFIGGLKMKLLTNVPNVFNKEVT